MIKAENLGFQYHSNLDFVFRHYSFELERGEIMTVLGPNGRGKTTLIKCLLGLLPLSEGEIETSGHRSYVPQNAMTPFDYDAHEIVVMGCNRSRGIFAHVTKADYLAADEALREVGMEAFARRPFASLSGGQKQMVLIARALVSAPDIMILDEPTSALDYKNQDRVLGILKRISEKGRTIIFSTHCPHQALHISDKSMIMNANGSYACGCSSEILDKDFLTTLYNSCIYRGMLPDDPGGYEYVIPLYSRPGTY